MAIITGTGSLRGIGYATARAFVNQGANVLMADLTYRCADNGSLFSSSPGKAIMHPLDVTNRQSWDILIEFASKEWSPADILVNNAGICQELSIVETTEKALDCQIAVNFKGTFLGCQAIIPTMQQGGGSIVNIASVSALIGIRSSAAYAATKGAVRALSRAIAIDEARYGIRCNTVHAGAIDTDMIAKPTESAPQAVRVPLGRFGTPDDVASMCLFLASDEASYVTGAEFVVDGGMSAK